MDIEIIIDRLGLPKHSYEVYKVLQKSGPLSVSDISKKIMVHRPAVYSALGGLLGHKFIFCEQKGKRKLYQAKHTRVIANEFLGVSKKISQKLGESSNKDEYVEENIRTLKGGAGVQKVFDDVINHESRGGTFYRYTSEKDLGSVNKYLSKDYRTRRDAKKLERLVISNPQSGEQKRPRLERFIKYISPQHSTFDHNIIQII